MLRGPTVTLLQEVSGIKSSLRTPSCRSWVLQAKTTAFLKAVNPGVFFSQLQLEIIVEQVRQTILNLPYKLLQTCCCERHYS